jgi:hypothetical protein
MLMRFVVALYSVRCAKAVKANTGDDPSNPALAPHSKMHTNTDAKQGID